MLLNGDVVMNIEYTSKHAAGGVAGLHRHPRRGWQ